MKNISQTKYNKMHCIKCGEYTEADLAAFNFSKIFAMALENNETWQSLVRLDLRFYYTIRDIYQELHFNSNQEHLGMLQLTVGQVIRQIEFLMKPVTFEQIKNSHHETLLYNNLYIEIYSNHGSSQEKMEDIEMLIRTLSSHQLDDVIVSLPIRIIFDKDDLNNEIPIGIKYNINNRLYEDFQRICPNCGGIFDKQAGYHHEFIIGLAGLARVGKTAYIASLIHQLKKYSLDDFISVSVANYKNNNSFIKFNEEIVAEYEAGKNIIKTGVEDSAEIPLVYISLNIEGVEYNFVFVDMPGEIYSRDDDEGIDFVSEKRHILKSADAIWCCIEPSMINSKYHNTLSKENKQNSFDQLANLANNLNNLYSNKLPACIILTQCDLLKGDFPQLFAPNINVIREYVVDDNNLNMTKVNQHAQYTCDFFKQMASFEATMKELFRGFSFFGIASYGFDVSDKANQNRNVQPSMVELPFLWTLATFGCINAKEIHTTTTILKKTVTNVNDITNQNELYFKGR